MTVEDIIQEIEANNKLITELESNMLPVLRRLVGKKGTDILSKKKFFVKNVAINNHNAVITIRENEEKTYRVDSALEKYLYFDNREILAEVFACYDKITSIKEKNRQLENKKTDIEKENEAFLQQLQVNRMAVEYLKARKVQRLLHFTNIENLKTIIEKGLIPVAKQRENEVQAIRVDAARWEGDKYNNLSVSFPNYKMFFKKTNGNYENYAIVEFSLDFILEQSLNQKVLFSHHNAADAGRDFGNNYTDLTKMFEEESTYKGKTIKRNTLKIPEEFTTDPQAEILVAGIIPSKYINKIYIPSNSKIHNSKDIQDVPVEVNNSFFSCRSDYPYWQDACFQAVTNQTINRQYENFQDTSFDSIF